ncbi:MAG: histidine ammonia-lyase [Tissierellia bacterium]|nr:histidine ammonia-lyase [Tissierellia bacterium]
MNKVFIGGGQLTLDEFIQVTRGGAQVELTEDAVKKIRISRQIVDDIVAEEKAVYGITTGFGNFSDVKISREQCKSLQTNLLMSHACGVGNYLREDQVKGVMLLRANNLANGYSGISENTLNTLIAMLNSGVVPAIPEKGSLGASGDLAPLAHMALPMLGLGKAFYEGELLSGAEAMKRAGVKTITMVEKEGLAITNGTQVMTSVGAHAVYDAIRVAKMADIATALTSEALNGITDAYDPQVHLVRGHAGQIVTAENLLTLLDGSEMTTRQGEIRTQDAYSLRCIPQIHGASKDCFNYVKSKVDIEMNATTDNPIIFPETRDVISGGNFHGQPMAITFDFLSIGISELANISERRIERLVNPALSSGLPAFLVEDGGVNSGFMIVQYAAAALVSENKVLAHPASVDSIPSSANQEDHVSMGTIAARQADEILGNVKKVIAMEMMTACQAIDLRGKKKLGKGSEVAYNAIREAITPYIVDREMYVDINKAEEVIFDNDLLSKVEAAIGELKF